MRILVTTNAAVGHLAPLAPTVRALAAAGHDVRVGCPASFAPTVDAAGLTPLACEEQPADATASSPPPREQRDRRLEWAVTTEWPAQARRWLDPLWEHAGAWRPDVVVVEPVEHAGRVVAAALGVPLVVHGWGFSLPANMAEHGATSLLDVYARLATIPTPPALTIDLGAASVQAADAAPVLRYRYEPWSLAGQRPPEPDGRPRVLVTLGTFHNPDAAERIRTVVAAAAAYGAQVIAALGNADRRSATGFPPGVSELDWIDLPNAVAGCDLVVHHGGAGTSWATLVAGRPALITPQMGDQFRNAELLVHAGVAVVVEPTDLRPTTLGDAIDRLLTDPVFAQRAAAVAAENLRLPDVAQLASDIAAVATAARPWLR